MLANRFTLVLELRFPLPKKNALEMLKSNRSNPGGRRVAVVDIPFGVKTPGLNGVQVHGWFVHGRVYPRVSEPDNLLRDLEQRHGPHPA